MATVAKPDVKGQKIALNAQYYVNRVKSGKMKINQVPKGMRKNVQSIVDQPVEVTNKPKIAKPKTGGRPRAWTPELVGSADPNDPIVKEAIKQAKAAYKVNPIDWRVSKSGAVLPPTQASRAKLNAMAAAEGSQTNVDMTPGERGTTTRSGKRTAGSAAEPTRTVTRESGPEKMLRERMTAAPANEVRQRISEAVKEIEGNKAKIGDFAPSYRAEIRKALKANEDAAKKAATDKVAADKAKVEADAKKPKTMTQDEIRKQMIEKGKMEAKDGLKAKPQTAPKPRPVGKFKPVDKAIVHKPGSETISTKSGHTFNAKNTLIFDSKTGKVYLNRAQRALESGLITQGEFDKFVKQDADQKTLKDAQSRAAKVAADKIKADAATANKAKPKTGAATSTKKTAAPKKAATKTTAPAAPESPKGTTATAPSAPAPKAKPKFVVESPLPGMGPKAPAVKKAAAAGKKAAAATKKAAKSAPAKPTATKPAPSKNYVQGVIDDIGKMDKGKLIKNAAGDAVTKAGPGKIGKAAKFLFETAMVAPIAKDMYDSVSGGVKNVAGVLKNLGDGIAPTKPKKFKATGRSADSKDASRTPKPINRQVPADRGAVGKGGVAPIKKFAPATPTGAAANIRATYTVKHGDTLWDIAGAHNTSVSKLLEVNPIIKKRKDTGKVSIFAGTKVRIPKK